jgi:flagellar biosynthesis/type III secretory pathway protein FliH
MDYVLDDEAGQAWEEGFDSGYKQGQEDARREILEQTKEALNLLLTGNDR